METTLTLVDGTVLNGYTLPNGDGSVLFVYLTGLSIMEGFTIFSDAGNIQTITETIDAQNVKVHKGYTKLIAINGEFGNCNITLRRGSDAA